MSGQLTCVYGGGGVFGIAFHFGVVDTLREHGVDLASRPALGTSAGSWVAAALAAGMSVDDFFDVQVRRIPTRDTFFLHRIATDMFAEGSSDLVSAVAVDIRTGRRTRLGGHTHRLADIVAASSAIPGVYPPFPLGGRRYVDGGLVSLASADLAPDGDHMLLIAPLSGVRVGVVGAVSQRLLRRECRRWNRSGGRSVTLVEPPHQVVRLAPTPWHMMDSSLAEPVYRATREWAQAQVAAGSLRPFVSMWRNL